MRRSQAHKIDGAVLVADDHELTRFGMVHLVRRSFSPSEVLQATSFDEAMSLLGNEKLKLVVCDLMMPGLNEAGRLACIRQRRPDVKLVVLSGHEVREAVLAALAAGAHGFLLKSASSEENLERLNYILDGQIYVPPLVADMASAMPQKATEAEQSEGTESSGLDQVKLSPRQLQVLEGMVKGLSNKEIGRSLGLAEGTIKMHVGGVLRALGATNRAHAAALGQRLLKHRESSKRKK